MEYSALIFETSSDEKSWNRLQEDITLFSKDEDCRQIVICAHEEWMLALAKEFQPKTMLVTLSSKMYVALLNGLKAVQEENVIVCHLLEKITQKQIDKIKSCLMEYPAVSIGKNFQGYDTRLLMFSLQVAIEQNLAIENYSQAVEALADTPLQLVEEDEKTK